MSYATLLIIILSVLLVVLGYIAWQEIEFRIMFRELFKDGDDSES